MTDFVVDYSWYRPTIAELKAADIVGVSRYLSWLPNSKVIDASEYALLKGAGIPVVLNWESDGKSWQGGYAQGQADGAEARKQARALGHPDERPIIQSIDMDVPMSSVSTACEYQRGFNAGGGCGPQGCYSTYPVLEAMRIKELIRVGWQTNATGWTGNEAVDPNAALVQHVSHTRPGLPWNQYDESTVQAADWGQCPAPLPPVPPAPPAPTPAQRKVIAALKALAVLIKSFTTKPVRYGDRGARVELVQRRLNVHHLPVNVDGKYGDETAAQVERFKFAHLLRNHDGHVVGGPCLRALLAPPSK